MAICCLKTIQPSGVFLWVLVAVVNLTEMLLNLFQAAPFKFERGPKMARECSSRQCQCVGLCTDWKMILVLSTFFLVCQVFQDKTTVFGINMYHWRECTLHIKLWKYVKHYWLTGKALWWSATLIQRKVSGWSSREREYCKFSKDICTVTDRNISIFTRSPAFRTFLEKMIYSLLVDLRSSVIKTTSIWMKVVSTLNYTRLRSLSGKSTALTPPGLCMSCRFLLYIYSLDTAVIVTPHNVIPHSI